ncbi:hypothetical protein GCM10023080_078720 [Streptomyces pseudoechinosporeus]
MYGTGDVADEYVQRRVRFGVRPDRPHDRDDLAADAGEGLRAAVSYERRADDAAEGHAHDAAAEPGVRTDALRRLPQVHPGQHTGDDHAPALGRSRDAAGLRREHRHTSLGVIGAVIVHAGQRVHDRVHRDGPDHGVREEDVACLHHTLRIDPCRVTVDERLAVPPPQSHRTPDEVDGPPGGLAFSVLEGLAAIGPSPDAFASSAKH